MATLSKITKDYKGLADEDLDPDQLTDILECIQGAFEDKAKNILSVINSMNTLEIDEEIKRLQARKKAIVNNKDRLKEYLRTNMEESGITKITHPLFTVTLGKPVQKVEIESIGMLPSKYVVTTESTKVDLNSIKADLKEGVVNGAKLVDGKSRLLIK